MIITTIGILVAILVFIPIYVLRSFDLKSLILQLYYLGKIPGPSPKYFLLGNIGLMHEAIDGVGIFRKLRQWALDYPTVYQSRLLFVPQLNIVNPYDAEKILANPVHMEKSRVYDLMSIWLQRGLLTSSGLKWRTRRRILTPAFHFNILKQYIECFNEATLVLVSSFKASCHQPYINISKDITHYTLSTMCGASLGTILTQFTDKEQLYSQNVDELHKILVRLSIRPWAFLKPTCWLFPSYYKMTSAIKFATRFTADIIKNRANNFQISELTRDTHDVYVGKKKLAMLDYLLSAKFQDKVIGDKDIQEEVDTFTFEGHDSSATALQFAILLLANHSEVQEKVWDEAAAVLNGEPFENLSYHHLQDMKYLDCVLNEVLRLYPSVNFISRQAGEDFTTHEGYFVPKNSMCNIHIYDLHHHPKYFPDPYTFDPERFLPENAHDRHPFAFIPFSAGMRNCIGQKFARLELKTAVVGILSNFVLKPIDTPSSVVETQGLFLRAVDGIRVKFEHRITSNFI